MNKYSITFSLITTNPTDFTNVTILMHSNHMPTQEEIVQHSKVWLASILNDPYEITGIEIQYYDSSNTFTTGHNTLN